MNTNVIEGNPTKKFFIEMITRDISIEDAIIDLLDNSIDGATQINPDDLSGFVINIEIDANKLSIKDNCEVTPKSWTSYTLSRNRKSSVLYRTLSI